MFFPKWLPYTVGLLIVGMAFGIIAQSLVARADCPMYALKYDMDADGYISRYCKARSKTHTHTRTHNQPQAKAHTQPKPPPLTLTSPCTLLPPSLSLEL